MKGGKSKGSAKEAGSKLSVAKKASGKTKSLKKAKPAKDPSKPKKPASAFLVFMEEFRVEYKEKNPQNKSVAAVSKAGGEKWKSMADGEKAPYVTTAESRKKEYTKSMQDYNKLQDEAPKATKESKLAEEESDKSLSEVNDNDDDGGEEEDDD